MAPLGKFKDTVRDNRYLYQALKPVYDLMLLRTLRTAIRRRQWRQQSPERTRSYLVSHSPACLHLGCGPNTLSGWLNCDIAQYNEDVVFLDAGEQLPFSDGSFDYVFSEHMIEHVPLSHALALLKEIWRVLKLGGVVRIATPDLGHFVQTFEGSNLPHQEAYFDWVHNEHFSGVPFMTAAMALNNIVTNFEHRFVFDRKTLAACLSASGFNDLMWMDVGVSTNPDLQGMERHGDYIGEEMNQFETMVIEATRG